MVTFRICKTTSHASTGSRNPKTRLASDRTRVLLWRVQVKSQCREVASQSQMHHPRIRLRRPDKRQQANHAELVRYHPRGNVRHPACSETTTRHMRFIATTSSEAAMRSSRSSPTHQTHDFLSNHHSTSNAGRKGRDVSVGLDWSDRKSREVSPSGNTWIPFFWLLFCAEAVLSPGNLGPSALDVLLLVEFKFYKWGREKKKETFLVILLDVQPGNSWVFLKKKGKWGMQY